MTTAVVPAAGTSLTADPLGTCLVALTGLLGVHLLVEVQDAHVASHAVADGAVPETFACAVVRRDVRALNVVHGRSTAVIAGGPVVEGQLTDGSRVVVAPLPSRTGWLWLVGSVDSVSVSAVAAAAASIDPLLVRVALDDPLRRALLGHDVGPPGLLLRGPRWLVAMPGDYPQPLALRGLMTMIDGCRYLLAADGVAERDVRERLGGATAVLTGPLAPDEALAPLRLPMQRAAARLAPGQVAALRERRAALVLEALAVEPLSDVVEDPVARLLEDPRRRTSAETLLAWLDAHGDFVAAAARLDVHVNTLRYRLSKLRRLLDLDDPAVRVEAHLRLRQALVGRW